jgi:Protein of unknown function (DUF995)
MRLSAAATIALLLLIAQNGITNSAQAASEWAPLDPAYLRSLYADRTWMWKHGAAYFGNNGLFKARSRSKGVTSVGFGTWDVGPDGRMCFSAAWRVVPIASTSEAKVTETCFSHSAKGRKIAQMREPDGKWYIFKHEKTRKNDEIRKLRVGDRTRLKSPDA